MSIDENGSQPFFGEAEGYFWRIWSVLTLSKSRALTRFDMWSRRHCVSSLL